MKLLHLLRLLTNELNQKELEEWAKNGFFRIHGFQRSWTLKNFVLVDDGDLWYKLANTLNDDVKEIPVRKVMLGSKRNFQSYIVLAHRRHSKEQSTSSTSRRGN